MQTTLTDDQMQDLAQIFHDLAFAIGQVRLDSLKAGASLKDPAIIQLQSEMFSLTNISSQCALADANLTLEEADKAVIVIRTATTKAGDALDKLKNLDKAVNIGAALIVLAAAITTRDPGQIAGCAKDVYDAASA